MNLVGSGRKPLVLILLILSFILGLGNVPGRAAAHPLNNGYSQVTILSDHIEYELFIPENSLLRWDQNGDKKLAIGELEAQRTMIEEMLRKNVRLEQKLQPLPMELTALRIEEKETIAGVSFTLRYTTDAPVERFTLYYDLLFDEADPLHLNFVLFLEGDDVDQTVLDSSHRSYQYVSLHPATPASVLSKYMWLGMLHIWTGYDHLLFLLSLLLVATRVKDMLKIVTAFTVAHSLTLALAATGVIRISPVWVETAIALSIAYVAIENMAARRSELRWLLTFAFGLIHGLGFAGALEEIGLPRAYFVSSLLVFNVGVELGQLLVVAAILPFLLRLQRRPGYRRWMMAGSAMILLLSVKWALERTGLWP